MPGLSITALGTLTFALDERPLTGFRSAKNQALLLYLAVESDRVHRREQLTDLLWPDADPEAAKANFRQSLSRLRRTLKDNQAMTPFLLVNRQTVQINPAAHITLDVARFLAMEKDGDLEGAAEGRGVVDQRLDFVLGRVRQRSPESHWSAGGV